MSAVTNNASDKLKPLYEAADVAALLKLAVPTVYQLAREAPERLGVERFGRSVRFRPSVIDRIVRGDV